MFQFIGILRQKILTLDKVEGVSIREIEKIKDLGIDKRLAENLIQLFLTQAVRDGFSWGYASRKFIC